MAQTRADILHFPFERTEGPFRTPNEYARARHAGGLVKVRMWNDNEAWLSTNYADVVAILTDNRFSADPAAPAYPSPTESRAVLLNNEPPALGQIDPPAHTRFRRMFTPMFTLRRMEDFRPQIKEIVDSALDAMLATGGPIDLCEAFAYKIPTTVIAAVMGVPQEDREFFVSCANARFFHTRDPKAALHAGELLGDYFERLLAAREAEPEDGSDVVNRLVRERIIPGDLSRKDAVVLLRNILVNGQDTTANTISLGTLLLLQNPIELEKLKADPSIAGQVVDEVLRIVTPPHFQAPRTALGDIEVRGTTIHTGEGVIASLVGANHDPAEYEDPERLDVERDASAHLSFGSGIHSCLGRQLAKLELEIAFVALFRRIPGLRLALRPSELRLTNNEAQAYGIYELPVIW